MAEMDKGVHPIFCKKELTYHNPPVLIPDNWEDLLRRDYHKLSNRLVRYVNHLKDHSDAVYPRLVCD